jgi:hypothetical protein
MTAYLRLNHYASFESLSYLCKCISVNHYYVCLLLQCSNLGKDLYFLSAPDFLNKIDEFCLDPKNIKDIKKRSYKYAEECEKVLKMATEDVHSKSQEQKENINPYQDLNTVIKDKHNNG